MDIYISNTTENQKEIFLETILKNIDTLLPKLNTLIISFSDHYINNGYTLAD